MIQREAWHVEALREEAFSAIIQRLRTGDDDALHDLQIYASRSGLLEARDWGRQAAWLAGVWEKVHGPGMGRNRALEIRKWVGDLYEMRKTQVSNSSVERNLWLKLKQAYAAASMAEEKFSKMPGELRLVPGMGNYFPYYWREAQEEMQRANSIFEKRFPKYVEHTGIQIACSRYRESRKVRAGELLTLYHVTPTYNLPSIKQKGLLLMVGKRSCLFGETSPTTFLFRTVEDAEQALLTWLGDEFPEEVPLALLEVLVEPQAIKRADPGVFEVEVGVEIPLENVRVLDENWGA